MILRKNINEFENNQHFKQSEVSPDLSVEHHTANFETAWPISNYAATLGVTGKKEIQHRYIDDFDTEEDQSLESEPI